MSDTTESPETVEPPSPERDDVKTESEEDAKREEALVIGSAPNMQGINEKARYDEEVAKDVSGSDVDYASTILRANSDVRALRVANALDNARPEDAPPESEGDGERSGDGS